MAAIYTDVSADNITGSKDKIISVILTPLGAATYEILHGAPQTPYFVTLIPIGNTVYTEKVFVSSITSTSVFLTFENVATTAMFNMRIHRNPITNRKRGGRRA